MILSHQRHNIHLQEIFNHNIHLQEIFKFSFFFLLSFYFSRKFALVGTFTNFRVSQLQDQLEQLTQ